MVPSRQPASPTPERTEFQQPPEPGRGLRVPDGNTDTTATLILALKEQSEAHGHTVGELLTFTTVR
jgi:hypothetical protein